MVNSKTQSTGLVFVEVLGTISLTMSLPLEKNLLISLKEGKHEAFSAIYDTYAGAIYGIICKNAPQDKDAEKILCEVFVRYKQQLEYGNEDKNSILVSLIKITNRLLPSKREQLFERNNEVPSIYA